MNDFPATPPKRFKTWDWLLVALAFVLMWFFSIRNSFVTYQRAIESSVSHLEENYQRQAALMPGLLDYLSTESATRASSFRAVLASYTGLYQANGIPQKVGLMGTIDSQTGDISRYIASSGLTKRKSFQKWAEELASVESGLRVEREAYNAHVQFYNSRLLKFPDQWVARLFHYQTFPLMESKP